MISAKTRKATPGNRVRKVVVSTPGWIVQHTEAFRVEGFNGAEDLGQCITR